MPVTVNLQNNVVSDSISTLSSTITHMATGDDDTTPVVSDNVLGNETYREAINNSSTTNISYSGDTLQDITENNGNDIDEIGLFDDPSSGDMYIHTLSNTIEKDGNTEAFIKSVINITVQST